MSFDAAPYIKDIGRGRDHPTDLSCDRACALWRAVLADELDPVALGGVLIAMRVKGETADEVAGFLRASEDFGLRFDLPAKLFAPVVIPSYNGARKLVNLTPLLALLLARQGVPVLVHGSSGRDIPLGRAQRVTSAAIFKALGQDEIEDQAQLFKRWREGLPGFIGIDRLHPELGRVLDLRKRLGVRSSAHTLVKLLQPFVGKALCLASYTHPEYQIMLQDLLCRAAIGSRRDTLLMRATEGEAVANARRAVRIEWFQDGRRRILEPDFEVGMQAAALPLDCSIDSTSRYVANVLEGRAPVPSSIAWQMQQIVQARDELKDAPEASLR